MEEHIDEAARERASRQRQTLSVVDSLCCFCQCPIMVTVLVFVGMLIAPLSGQTYFTLGKPGFTPICRAILHPVTYKGAKIDLGPHGGGTFFKETVIEPKVLTASVYGSAAAANMDMNAVVTMESAQCKLMSVSGRMMDADKAIRLPMPGYCGSADDDSWRAGDDGGVWVTPVIMGSMLWFFLRSWGLALPQLLAGGHHPVWTGYGIAVIKVLCKWQAYAMLAPITTLQVSKGCPQVATAFYSSHSQIGLLCAWLPTVGFTTPMVMLLYCVWPADEDMMRKRFGYGCVLCAWTAWSIIATTYYFFIMTTCGWEFVLNISLDFSLDWPEFALAKKIQVTKILLFVLGVLDVLDLVFKFAVLMYDSRRKEEGSY